MNLYHVNATYEYHRYDFIVSSEDDDSAIKLAKKYMNNLTSEETEFDVFAFYICDTTNEEVFYEIDR